MSKAEPTTKKAANRAAGSKKADASNKAGAKQAPSAPVKKTGAPAKAAALKKEVAKQPAKPAKPPTAKPATANRAPAKKEPAKKEPVTGKKEPAKQPPVKAAAKAAPAKPAPARPATAKPATAKPATAKKEPAKPSAAKVAAKTAPAKAQPVKAEPVKKAVRKTTVICPLSGFEVKPDKPNLSPRTIDRLRTKLLEERARHLNQADALQAEAAQLALDREEGDTQFDEEGGEGDTISVERERDLMLSASARQIVEEIDAALERIKNKTYGLCAPAGRRISVERLEALPYADTCVDCKARAERRR